LRQLAFAELGTAASTVKTGLLAFLHAGIASQEAIVSQRLEVLIAHPQQGTSDSHADRSRLTGQTTTADANRHIDAVGLTDVSQRLQYILLVLGGWKEYFERLAVDDNFTASCAETNPSYRRLATTGAQTISSILVFLYGYHEFPNVLVCAVICIELIVSIEVSNFGVERKTL
jgi:hypothetical protein